MAFTQTDLSRIERAIASGTLTVEVDGQKMTYQSMSDLFKVRDLIKGELESSSQSSSTTLAVFDGEE